MRRFSMGGRREESFVEREDAVLCGEDGPRLNSFRSRGEQERKRAQLIGKEEEPGP